MRSERWRVRSRRVIWRLGVLRHRDTIHPLLQRDKTPLAILLLAALVGALTGLVGVAFERAVNGVMQYRFSLLAGAADSALLVWLLAFAISAVLAMVGYWLVRRFAPEAASSGIPDIEGALEGLRPVRWWRVLPVKFIGGMGTLGAGMVLDIFCQRGEDARHRLLATGAASGLSAAFNAPLAGILFIIEEMRPQFHYNLISIKAVFTGVIMSGIVFRLFNGETTVIGPLFNALVLRTQDLFQWLHDGNMTKWVLIGGLCGVLGLAASAGNFIIGMLLFIFIARVLTTLLCFSSGAPGGIFAPMLALGTVLGTVFGMVCIAWFPAWQLEAGTFAIAGMGALFASSVRAPLTGIVLVLEMTDNYQLILPMIIICLGATLLAQFIGGKPLYATILACTLARQADAPSSASKSTA